MGLTIWGGCRFSHVFLIGVNSDEMARENCISILSTQYSVTQSLDLSARLVSSEACGTDYISLVV